MGNVGAVTTYEAQLTIDALTGRRNENDEVRTETLDIIPLP